MKKQHSHPCFRALPLLLLLALLGCAFTAAAEGPQTLMLTDTMVFDVETPYDDPARAFIDRYLHPGAQTRGTGDTGTMGKNLSGQALYLYKQLYAAIPQIAAGTRESTEFTFQAKDVLAKTTFTKAELGVSAFFVNGVMPEETQRKLSAAIQEQLTPAMNALLLDLPLDLYWYNKTRGMNFNYGIDYDDNSITLNGNFIIRIAVAGEYASTDIYHINPNYYGSNVQAAVNNAKAIVNSCKNLSDVEKLRAYRDKICEMTSYNHDAVADGSTTPYGNPWQMIWVFDGKAATTVVCEGYTKAFQYLCDLSSFQNSAVSVIMASGYNYNTQDGSGGGHMWNIVTMEDGRNYLVDVTNCDRDNAAPTDELFLKGYYQKRENGSDVYYFYSFGSTYLQYVYADSTLSIAKPAQLALSAEDYAGGSSSDQTAIEQAVIAGVYAYGNQTIAQYRDYTLNLQFPEDTLTAYFAANPIFEVIYHTPNKVDEEYAYEKFNLYTSLSVTRQGAEQDDLLWFSASASRYLPAGDYQITVRNYRADGKTLMFERTVSLTVTAYNRTGSYTAVFDKQTYYVGEAITGRLCDANGNLYTGAVDAVEFALTYPDGLFRRKTTWSTGNSRVTLSGGKFSFPADFNGSVEVEMDVQVNGVWYWDPDGNAQTISMGGEIPVTALGLNQRVETAVLSLYGQQLFSFTPSASGTYTFMSQGSSDTKAELLDAGRKKLASDGENKTGNFSISYALAANQTYYLQVSLRAGDPSSFGVVVVSQQNAYTDPDFVLPANLTQIEAQAFCGISARRVKLGEKVKTIGALAFAECHNLESVYIPASCTKIDATAFDGKTGITICGHAGSYAQTFASQHNLPFESVD